MRRNAGENLVRPVPGMGHGQAWVPRSSDVWQLLLGCSSMKSSFQINVTYSARRSEREGRQPPHLPHERRQIGIPKQSENG